MLRVALIALAVTAAPTDAVALAGKAKARRVRLPAERVVDPATAAAIATAISDAAGGATKRFYAARDYRPLWTASGRPGAAARALLGYLVTAEADGLRAGSYDVEDVRGAVEAAAGGDPRAVGEAEVALSDAFARYVRDQRRVRGGGGMIFADRTLKPAKLKPEAVLRAAAFPESFTAYVTDMGWMSPQYVRLRALAVDAARGGASEEALARLRVNMDRARVLPGPYVQHVEVDASSGRLWYYEAGRQVGTMRVVVGTHETQTPLLAGRLQWAILNPYWNVPDYLAQGSIAKKVLGGRSLKAMHMEALTDWSADAQVLPDSAIDWTAVAAGRQVVRLRQLPGPANSMGRVKFLFPNDEGIYLHDTPDRDLLRKDDRHLSNGCIRLEDAAALGRWLLQKPLPRVKAPEQAVPLPVAVPVYLTYLTPVEGAAGLAFRPDVYGRDG